MNATLPRQLRLLGVAPCALPPGEIGVDLFAGGGGWSEGFQRATGAPPAVAVNHDEHAIAMHRANHPEAEHHREDVFAVDPIAATRGRPVGWLHGSPDCTHFSRAKGGKPRSKHIRGLAWVLVKWAAAVAPRILSLENVAEFLSWGPLDADGQPDPRRAGETFAEFLAQLRALGYAVDHRTLCAADFGDPTLRRRLFLVARRDGIAPRWPQPTHGTGRALPYRTAAECIDWTDLGRSIFERERPLADATCRRIAAGVMRYVAGTGRPFLVQTGYGERAGQAPRCMSVDAPLGTVVAGGSKHALVSAFLAKHYTGVVGSDLRAPLGTITATDHHSLVAAHLTKFYGTSIGADPRAPLATITGGAGGGHHGLVAAFLSKYYGTGATGQDLRDPLHTITAGARFALVLVHIDGEPYVITDIRLRMLRSDELALAQGFPAGYHLHGTERARIARIGNSVCPGVAEALVRANLEAA